MQKFKCYLHYPDGTKYEKKGTKEHLIEIYKLDDGSYWKQKDLFYLDNNIYGCDGKLLNPYKLELLNNVLNVHLREIEWEEVLTHYTKEEIDAYNKFNEDAKKELVFN